VAGAQGRGETPGRADTSDRAAPSHAETPTYAPLIGPGLAVVHESPPGDPSIPIEALAARLRIPSLVFPIVLTLLGREFIRVILGL
jgi:hypothetical protein